jgi:hypothetical protein
LALTSQTSGGRSVGIVHLRTKATEFVFVLFVSVQVIRINEFQHYAGGCKHGFVYVKHRVPCSQRQGRAFSDLIPCFTCGLTTLLEFRTFRLIASNSSAIVMAVELVKT